VLLGLRVVVTIFRPRGARLSRGEFANTREDVVCEDSGHSKGDDLSIYDIPVNTLSGEPTTLEALRGKALLVVNVASKCGLTPQYTGLEQLQKQYGEQGFSVVGFPCNQFMGQEPGTAEEIETFCSTTYGVTFPLFEKIEVNGEGRHPVYAELTRTADADGTAGDVQWNFEKFLISPEGEVVARFRPATTPEDEQVVKAIEAVLPA
jgi:glutathione peroxidase